MISNKIKHSRQLKIIISRLRKQGKIIVFTNGCFDLLHYGHARYLEDAKKEGDILVVAVNSDESVQKIKGDKRPVVSQGDRLKLLAALESVDYVTLFHEQSPLRLIRDLEPDVLVKGADWDKEKIVGKDIVLSCGGKVSTIKLVKGRSTTKLIKKIAKLFKN